MVWSDQVTIVNVILKKMKICTNTCVVNSEVTMEPGDFSSTYADPSQILSPFAKVLKAGGGEGDDKRS